MKFTEQLLEKIAKDMALFYSEILLDLLNIRLPLLPEVYVQEVKRQIGIRLRDRLREIVEGLGLERETEDKVLEEVYRLVTELKARDLETYARAVAHLLRKFFEECLKARSLLELVKEMYDMGKLSPLVLVRAYIMALPYLVMLAVASTYLAKKCGYTIPTMALMHYPMEVMCKIFAVILAISIAELALALLTVIKDVVEAGALDLEKLKHLEEALRDALAKSNIAKCVRSIGIGEALAFTYRGTELTAVDLFKQVAESLDNILKMQITKLAPQVQQAQAKPTAKPAPATAAEALYLGLTEIAKALAEISKSLREIAKELKEIRARTGVVTEREKQATALEREVLTMLEKVSQRPPINILFGRYASCPYLVRYSTELGSYVFTRAIAELVMQILDAVLKEVQPTPNPFSIFAPEAICNTELGTGLYAETAMYLAHVEESRGMAGIVRRVAEEIANQMIEKYISEGGRAVEDIEQLRELLVEALMTIGAPVRPEDVNKIISELERIKTKLANLRIRTPEGAKPLAEVYRETLEKKLLWTPLDLPFKIIEKILRYYALMGEWPPHLVVEAPF